MKNKAIYKVRETNPFELEGRWFEAEKRKDLRLRAIDTHALGYPPGAEIKLISLEGEQYGQVGDVIMTGVIGEIYFNAREKFINNNFLLIGKHKCTNDEVIAKGKGFSIVCDGETVNFTPEKIMELPSVQVIPTTGVLKVVKMDHDFEVHTSWGTQTGVAGDYIIVRDKNDFYRHCGKIMEKAYILYEYQARMDFSFNLFGRRRETYRLNNRNM